jgi:thermitase
MRFARLAVPALTAVVALAGAAGASAQDPNEDPQCSYPETTYQDPSEPFANPITNDPISGEQWGLRQIKAPPAWQRATGAGVVIAVVDTGADYSHPDLQAKLLPGADFAIGENAGDCEGAQDEQGHGTHVSGIAAAITNNFRGVAGTAPDAQILPVRVLDKEGSAETDEPIVQGIRYAADQGAKVINLSLGPQFFGFIPNRQFEEAIQYAYDRGAVTVAAAGNDSQPLCSTPASAPRTLCVASTDRRGAPSWFSNFPNDPDDDGNVAVRAPGGGTGGFLCEDVEDVWSTIWPGSESDCQGASFLEGYDTLSGTSMSAPHAAGIAAMLAQQGLNPGQILECFRTTSSKRGSYDPVMGWGIVDADAATSQCSPQSTAQFTPAPGSGSGGSGGSGPGATQGLRINVRAHRTSRRRLARTRLLGVTVSASGEALVRLRALIGRRGSSNRRQVGRKTVYLGRAGRRTVQIRLRRVRRALRRRNRTIQVAWEGMGQSGFATARR